MWRRWWRSATPRRAAPLAALALVGVGASAASVTWRAQAADEADSRPHLVVLGTGWGGMTLLRELDVSRWRVTVVSPSNYFVLTPALHHVATGSVSAASASDPLREFLGAKFDAIEYVAGAATDVDVARRTVAVAGAAGGESLRYDRLVVAVGAAPSAPAHALPLGSLEDAEAIRQRTVLAFERAAALARRGAPRDQLADALRFVVVGGAPESSELAYRMAQFVQYLEKYQYPELGNKAHASVRLIESSTRARNTYDAKIIKAMEKRYAHPALEIVSAVVHKVDPNEIAVLPCEAAARAEAQKLSSSSWFGFGSSNSVNEKDLQKFPFAVCVWAAPRQPCPIVERLRERLGAESQPHRFALQTDDHLRVLGANDIYAIGDCASIAQTRLIERVMQMFQDLDENRDGTLDISEFKELVGRYQHEFPQLTEWAERTDELFRKADVNQDGVLSSSEFHDLLIQVDRDLTRLPSTAQTAFQEGRYLARIFSDHSSALPDPLQTRGGNRDIFRGSYSKDDDGSLPFRYKHLGGFEYVGYDEAITKRGTQAMSIIDGPGAVWMWRSALITRVVRKRFLARILADRATSAIAGRDTTNTSASTQEKQTK